MDMVEWVIIIGVYVLILCFPIFYIMHKKGKHKLFYLASCFGVTNFTLLLFAAATAPVVLLLVKVIPQIAEYGYVENILFILRGADFISEYYFITLYPALSILTPILIYKRYAMFRSPHPSN